MTIEELLNPLDESINMDGATDEEIFKAVMDSKAQRENMATNNGDNDIDDDSPIAPPQSRHEALRPKLPSKSTFQSSMSLMHTSWRAFWQTLPVQLGSLRPKK